jgi:beta-ureidopropionase / N-carbamoyl-L-amino-acid hydrolase
MGTGDRLREDLIATGSFGRAAQDRIDKYELLDRHCGVTRPTGSEGNKEIRDYAVDSMKEAGLAVRIDRIGNIFGRKDGGKRDQGTILCGSHLDSVINGGMFDGTVGVFGAIEAVRRMNDAGFKNARPVEVVVFTAEEGSAFKQTLLGSSVLVGKTGLSEALSMKNDSGETLGESLRNIGYRGTFQKDLSDVEYMLELHIEQGPILHSEHVPIGVVENITGIIWIIVTIEGQGNHAGTTPMSARKDALVAASDIVAFVNRRAGEMSSDKGMSMVGTVGRLCVFPNGINIIPEKVEMGIDIRDVVLENMESLRSEISKRVEDLKGKFNVDVGIQVPVIHHPVSLSSEVAGEIEKSAASQNIRIKRMNSGAVHDSQNMAAKVKTGMIFVPSFRGISHSPMEWTEWEDIEKGVQVLTRTIMNLSER